jgi:hypothetical protein
MNIEAAETPPDVMPGSSGPLFIFRMWITESKGHISCALS